jgi:hypothetical protein
MATLSRGITYGATEILTNTKLHQLVDLGAVTNIVDADISPSANIQDTKIADITTGGKVRGQAISDLANIPSSAGAIPSANMPGTVSQAIVFTDAEFTTADVNGGTIDGTTIGLGVPATGIFSVFNVGTVNQGDVLYDNGTSIVRLAPGINGHFLKTNGAGANPEWAELVLDYYADDASLIFSFANAEGNGRSYDSYGWDLSRTSLSISDITIGQTGRGCYTYDGTNDDVRTTSADWSRLANGRSNITAEVWVNPSKLTDDFVFTSQTQNEFSLILRPTNAEVKLATAGGLFTASGAHGMSTGNYYYIAFTYDGTTVRLYVNGVEVGTDTTGSGVVSIANDILMIGTDTTLVNRFGGQIDGLRIYTRTMTPAQVAERYSAYN